MDFIPFSSGSNGSVSSKSPKTIKQGRNNSFGLTLNTNIKGNPAFGSPALSFGSPALPFGAPANPNPGFSPAHRQQSPGLYRPGGPRQSSPRFHCSNPFTPPTHSHRPFYQGGLNEGGTFRTPRPSYSPGGNGGRGSGRKSFQRQFAQTPRLDPNNSAGGSSYIEDYYHPSMVMDPWRNLRPVAVGQIKEGSL